MKVSKLARSDALRICLPSEGRSFVSLSGEWKWSPELSQMKDSVWGSDSEEWEIDASEKKCKFHSNFLQLPAPKFHNTLHSNLWRQMKTTKTGPFHGNLYLMPNRV